MKPTNSRYSMEELCEELSISSGTVQNWMKRNVIFADGYENNRPFFSFAQINLLKEKLQSKESTSLKSRRNKLYTNGFQMYKAYSPYPEALEELKNLFDAIGIYFTYETPVSEILLRCILAECTLQLFAPDTHNTNLLTAYLSNSLCGTFSEDCTLEFLNYFINELLMDKKEASSVISKYPEIFAVKFHKRQIEDLLGLIYQSLQSLGCRKKQGAYFTPQKLTKEITESLTGEKILDPSCGTGSFLLSLCQKHPIANLYGYDIDALSNTIVKINMALHGNCRDLSLLNSHFIVKNTLLSQSKKEKFDVIVGNPPWGSNFSSKENILFSKMYQCVEKGKPEAFSLFLEKSLNMLKIGGTLSFLIPEALLQVKKHAAIRLFLCQNAQLLSIFYLGNVFHEVQCPCIILTLKKIEAVPAQDTLLCKGAFIRTFTESFTISEYRNVTYTNFSFLTNDHDYKLLEKIRNVPCEYLKSQCDFALGVVTGNNKELLSSSHKNGLEPIVSGKDVDAYQIRTPKNYIKFSPKKLQQCAPEASYRAKEKLVYRFINTTPVVAYDNNGFLTLNSCNILIPHIPDMDMKYILALLNSSVLQFYFKNTYSTLKILRSQLEELPLAIPTKNQQEQVIHLVDEILNTKNDIHKKKLMHSVDALICDIYGVNC